MKGPEYDFEDFKIACSEKGKVKFIENSLQDADDHFNLGSPEAVLDFISNDGLEGLQFINRTPWRKNWSSEAEIFVDAYHFRTGGMFGYLAFLFSPMTKCWVIKSFKLDNDRNTAMENALRARGWFPTTPKKLGDSHGNKE
ncbi:MAG: hypothetical protein WCQ90_14250 [Deltaproteobacteria bacterium]